MIGSTDAPARLYSTTLMLPCQPPISIFFKKTTRSGTGSYDQMVRSGTSSPNLLMPSRLLEAPDRMTNGADRTFSLAPHRSEVNPPFQVFPEMPHRNPPRQKKGEGYTELPRTCKVTNIRLLPLSRRIQPHPRSSVNPQSPPNRSAAPNAQEARERPWRPHRATLLAKPRQGVCQPPAKLGKGPFMDDGRLTIDDLSKAPATLHDEIFPHERPTPSQRACGA